MPLLCETSLPLSLLRKQIKTRLLALSLIFIMEENAATGTKKRKPNWTHDECIYLSRLVDEKKSVLRAKFGLGVTTMKKREAWQSITDKINSTSTTKRTIEEVEKKWNNLLMKGKAELSDIRRSLKKTGTYLSLA